MANDEKAKGLLAVLRGAVDRHVKQRPRDNIVANAEDDENEVLAQREVGDTACQYCSSRGNSKPVPPRFVSKEYHQYCKCHIRLVFSKAKKAVTRSGAVGRATYIKKRGDLELVERIGIDMLTYHGVSLVVPEEDPLAAANIDLLIDGELWEMKNVTNKKSSLKRQVRRAVEKWEKLKLNEPVRVVITTYGCKDSFDEIVERASRKTSIDELIVVSETRFFRK